MIAVRQPCRLKLSASGLDIGWESIDFLTTYDKKRMIDPLGAENGPAYQTLGHLDALPAGTRLGELAVSGAAGQLRLRNAFATGLQESDLIPEVRDLPEFMRQEEFVRRFGGTGQPRYQAMVQRIEKRLAALPLYR